MRVPQLGGVGGYDYTTFRQHLGPFMARQNPPLTHRDYAVPIPNFVELAKRIDEDADEEEAIFAAMVLGKPTSSPTSMGTPAKTGRGASSGGTYAGVASGSDTAAIKVKQESAEADKMAEAKKAMAAKINRSRKAHAILLSAVQPDIKLLLKGLPDGYAFAVLDLLEKKFRNTEADSIYSLWQQFTALAQEPNEDFAHFKARVDEARELLTHANDTPSEQLYTSILLWKLQPSYASVMSAMTEAGKLKDVKNINWIEVKSSIEQHERAQLALGTTEAARTMVARTRSQPSSKPQGDKDLSHVKCWNCNEMGHYSNKCPLPQKKKSPRKPKSKKAAWSSKDNSSDDESGGRTSMMRTSNMYDSLSSDDDEEEDYTPSTGIRSYAAMALGVSSVGSSSNSFSSSSTSRAVAKSMNVTIGTATHALSKEKKTKVPSSSVRAGILLSSSKSASSTSAGSSKPTPSDNTLPNVSRKKSLDEELKTTSKAIDTGATVSTTCYKNSLSNMKRVSPPMVIRMANGSVLNAQWKGNLQMKLPVSGHKDKWTEVVIEDVYWHEDFDANLLSWDAMRRDGWQLHSTSDGTYLFTPGGKRVDARSKGKLMLLEDTYSERLYGMLRGINVPNRGIIVQDAEELISLHERLCHVSWTRLVDMCDAGATVGIGSIKDMDKSELAKAEKAIKECAACAEGKYNRKPIGHGGLDKGTRAGEVLHMDTFVATTRDPITMKKRTEYCLLAVDGFSEYRWCDPKQRMSDIQQAIIDIIRNSHNLTDRYPRLLITDLGTEFMNKTVHTFCREHGITIQPSPARAKELNGLAEKNVNTMKDHVRTIMRAAKMPTEFAWTWAIQHFVYTWNRTHIGNRSRITPNQLMTGREQSIMNIGKFGCDVFIHQHRSMRDSTWDPKAEPGVYLGHSNKMNCPCVYVLRTNKIVMSKDVHFREGSCKNLRAVIKGQQADVEAIDLMRPETDDIDDDFESASEVDTPTPVQEAKPHVDSDQRWEIESIKDNREYKGVLQYRIKWGDGSLSWQPAATIIEDAPELVSEYETSLVEQAAAYASARASRSTRSHPTPQPPPQKEVSFETHNSLPSNESDNEAEESKEDSEESEINSAVTYAARCLQPMCRIKAHKGISNKAEAFA